MQAVVSHEDRKFESAFLQRRTTSELSSSSKDHAVENPGFSTQAAEFARENNSLLERSGFELPVPREISSGFEASAELGPIDPRRGSIIRAVVGLGKPTELLRRLEEPSFSAE